MHYDSTLLNSTGGPVMGIQLHKLFSTEEVIAVLDRYLSREIDIKIALQLLKIKRRRFF